MCIRDRLGMESHNLEEIWIYGDAIWGCTGQDYVKFGANIFEFMSLLEQFWITDGLEDHGLKSSRVYKNWGEDFWRVREEKEES